MKKIKGSKILKNINRKKIIETILEHKLISRADISKITGLNKATISEQISALLDEKLLIEHESNQNNVGRKPILLCLNPKAGFAIGVDLDSHKISSILTDLKGNIVDQREAKCESISFEYVFKILCDQITDLITNCPPSEHGVIGIGIGIHSIVNTDNTIVYDPNFKWKDIGLKSLIENEYNIPAYIFNNNNLCAFAEKIFYADTTNLICISLSSGIGSGIFINNKIYSGNDGFAGEVGHMIIVQDGRPCPCGNKGCWEQYASEHVFLEHIANLKGLSSCNLKDIKNFLSENDTVVIEAFEELANYVYVGINNIINIFNPEVVVINSELLRLYPKVLDIINSKLISSMNYYSKLFLSSLGEKACVLGGAAMCINKFLNISNINFVNEDKDI